MSDCPGLPLRTYVHLMDAGVGDADFFDEAVGARSIRYGDSNPGSRTDAHLR
jgi:hypothetical protein